MERLLGGEYADEVHKSIVVDVHADAQRLLDQQPPGADPYSDLDTRFYTAGALLYRRHHEQPGKPLDYTPYNEQVQTGQHQRAAERVWSTKITQAPTPQDIRQLLGAYDRWLDTLQDTPYYPAANRLHPTDLFRVVANWMVRHNKPFLPDGDIPTQLRELFLTPSNSSTDAPNRFRQHVLAGMRMIVDARHRDRTYQGSRQLVEAVAIGALPPANPGADAPVWFDTRGEHVDLFAERCVYIANRPQVYQQERAALQKDATQLITDTFGLIAAEGGAHADRLWSGLARQAQQVGDISLRGIVTLDLLAAAANAAAEHLNANRALGKLTLDRIPAKLPMLPEIFRRLLYYCLDDDPALDDEPGVADKLDIDYRIEVVSGYAAMNLPSKATYKPTAHLPGVPPKRLARLPSLSETMPHRGRATVATRLYYPGWHVLS